MELVISADGHVNEQDELWARVPERFREQAQPRLEKRPEGYVLDLHGSKITFPRLPQDVTADELDKEFRRDPSGGTDLELRLKHQARDGVHAEVVFPNLLLALGKSPDAELNLAVARAYNDWVLEVFAPLPDRFLPVAWIPVEDIASALAEMNRCLAQGFRSLMLPVSFPWRPYDRPEYEPLWELVEQARVPLNFHVFTGNLGFGTDFVYLDDMSAEQFALRRARSSEVDEIVERLSTTVIGMAAGMGPIVHLTGAGVLERHPELRFIVTEAECGWLAWTLHAMNAMQERRRLGLEKLSMRASEYFKRQGAVTITDDPVALRNLEFTGTDCILWGSDYPHDEGTYPRSEKFRAEIRAAAGPEDAQKIFSGNAARLYGFDLDRIAASVSGA